MKDQDLPEELEKLFYLKDYSGRYYKGYWEIVNGSIGQCDQWEPHPHVYQNELTIVLHPKRRNSNTWFYFFKIKGKEVELNILGTRWNGNDIWTKNIPYGKNKINKVLKWLKEKAEEKDDIEDLEVY